VNRREGPRKGPENHELMATRMGNRKAVGHQRLRNSRGGTRTPDPVINSHLLYQLSYSGLRSRPKTSGQHLVRQRAGSFGAHVWWCQTEGPPPVKPPQRVFRCKLPMNRLAPSGEPSHSPRRGTHLSSSGANQISVLLQNGLSDLEVDGQVSLSSGERSCAIPYRSSNVLLTPSLPMLHSNSLLQKMLQNRYCDFSGSCLASVRCLCPH